MDIGQVVFLLVDLVIGLGIGAVAVYFVMRSRAQVSCSVIVDVEQARLLEEAQLKAKQMELAAKDEAIKIRDEAEAEANKRRQEWQREEERLARKREDLDQKLERVDQRERKSNQRQSQTGQAGQRSGKEERPDCDRIGTRGGAQSGRGEEGTAADRRSGCPRRHGQGHPAGGSRDARDGRRARP